MPFSVLYCLYRCFKDKDHLQSYIFVAVTYQHTANVAMWNHFLIFVVLVI